MSLLACESCGCECGCSTVLFKLLFWNNVCMETCVGEHCCFSNTLDSYRGGPDNYLSRVKDGKPPTAHDNIKNC